MTAPREPDPSPPAPPPPPPAPPPPPDLDLRQRLVGSPTMRLVGLAGQAMGNRYRRVLAEEDGLSPGAAGVLNALAWGQGRGLEAGTPGRATHSELAQRCMITPATLTGLVSTLEKAGYVRRRRDESDRRIVWLTLTEAGEARSREIGLRAKAANDELMRKLTPELEAALRDFLITVIENDLAVVHQETSVLSEHTSTPAHPGHRAPTARSAPPVPTTDQPAPGRTPC
ncbi:MarR family winged helix-turn-helix transcriptional regulator [Actinospica robiniae]|uniref:MarR family winged helix-turn-helix transcriptional regulator n=1 Tax=Actinospica robiniae TaxID=304901 RepID=UPI0003FB5712|nr:MarR family winged helix-turn-helix transcriptional regulator [Actinospica robiniae]